MLWRPSLRRRLTATLIVMGVADFLIGDAIWNTIDGMWAVRSSAVLCLPVVTNPYGTCYNNQVTAIIALPVLVLTPLLLLWIHWRVAGWALGPLLSTARAVRRLGPQNLGQRIRLESGPDALKELADALDDALDRLAAGYEGQRRFAANASHELRTPLAVQRVLTEVAMENPAAGDDLQRLGVQLLRANERNERLIEGLLVLAESDRGLTGKVPVRLDELAGKVLEAHSQLAEKHEVELRQALRPCLVPGDPFLLERLITNLVANAIVYNEPGGWAEVSVGNEGRPALAVANTGEHIPAEAVDALFEPFRRLGADRVSNSGGVGLGLSIVRSIVTAHAGAVHAAARPEGGLAVSIELPVKAG